ncbi:MAG TPA: PIN domain-containing protein [Vicinamibacterales bacterium]|nr:PIN domain-containing protein [Vicinamibacterales bacterium]
MWLVDTSVWILTFQRGGPSLEDLVPIDEVVTALPVIQEVLQGFRDERAFRTARESMLALPLVEPTFAADLMVDAAQLYRAARRAGITPRSSVDCLIATCAIRHHIPVLHADRDYDALTRVSALVARNIAPSTSSYDPPL